MTIVAAPAGSFTEVDTLAVSTIRFLAADAVQAANSGHPGLPLGMAPAAWVLWSRFLRHDPNEPDWPDRDRFVLSAGHGSMLLYALLHLFGYDLSLDELRRFRQLGSRTPGHPEAGHTPGVETTTGPLGQGLAGAVGMALAERMLAARCNTERHRVVDHRTWVLAGDGDLMEGISHEAASLAGRLGLGRLTVIYDDNDVTIDGPASRSCTDDVLARFAAYGWRTLRVADGTDLDQLATAMHRATELAEQPTLVAVRSVIGHGAPDVAGTSAAHGSPLGAERVAAMRRGSGWPAREFHVPEPVRALGARLAHASAQRTARWWECHREWARANPALARAFPLDRVPEPGVPPERVLPERVPQAQAQATRVASGAALRALAEVYPALVGGSADLAASTNTAISGGDVEPGDYRGRTIHFGIREHAMAAACNGIAVHGGLRPFASTFLVFADYLRPALRLSALMAQPVIYVFTHDSVYVGEDGPTHQPVEQLESLRLIPGLTVLRPADAAETALAWQLAATNLAGPTALVLSRQALPALPPDGLTQVRHTGWRTVLAGEHTADVVLAASGSEVALALASAEALRAEGIHAEVRSVPWRARLRRALRAGTEARPGVPVVWIEAGVRVGWLALAGPADAVVGVDRFGASGPGAQVAELVGLSVPHIVATARRVLGRKPDGRNSDA